MPKSDHDRIKDLESRVGTSGSGGTINVTTGTTANPTSVYVEDELVGTERIINFKTTGQIAVQGFDDPSNDTMNLTFTTSNVGGVVGDDDVGAGAGTGTGYVLSSTTGAAIDLNQDMVIPADPGQLILCLFDAKVTAGTGAVYIDLFSVNSGLYASSEGITATGWTSLQTPGSTTLYKNVFVPFYTTSDDIDPGTDTATLRWMYRLSTGGGSPLIVANDVDGHLHKTYVNTGTVSTIEGVNIGAPPVTPPAAGAVTDRGTTTKAYLSTASRTIASSSFHPATNAVLYAFSQWHIEGVNAATVAVSIADTFTSGGTAWTAVTAAEIAVAAPNAANSNSGWVFRRTVAASTTGSITVTSNVVTNFKDGALTIAEISGYNEAPSASPAPGTISAANITSLTNTFTAPAATSLVFAWLDNVGSAVPAGVSTIPSNGGTWTALSNQVPASGFECMAVAYIIGSQPTQANWTGLHSDVATSIAGFVVLDPSGAATAAPGTESFDKANSAVLGPDMTWTQRT